jgi:hypothetical protein
MELIEVLTRDLGVKRTQAEGGVGLVLQLAKEQMSERDFSEVAKLVPGMQEMLAAAEANPGIADAWQKMASAHDSRLGEKTLKSLAGGFLGLGLDCSSVSKFIPFILRYIQCKGGDEINSLRERDLK